MKVTVSVLLVALLAQATVADIYMHTPRGSNNRNARTDNNDNRRNGNRVFDSQNNDKGGYSAPRAFPFDCYVDIDNQGAHANCVNQNAGQGKNALNALGELTNPKAIRTETMSYFSGSELTVEWTAQHGAGNNAEVVSDVIIQFACEDTLNDNCAPVAPGANPIGATAGQKTCIPRDGTPIRVADGNNGLNAEATDRIPDNAADQNDMRYGRHESLAFYAACQARERNKGLFTADQNLNGNDARFTRQNPNANRNGLECPEESEYYPYWASSPWKDVAIVTNDASKCAFFQAESQNVKGRGRCQCNGAATCNGNGKVPNNPTGCAAIAGAQWVQDAPFGIPPPACVVGAYSRQNHLGNTGAGPNNMQFNWTIPQVATQQRCALRVRYNMTSTDFGGIAIKGDASLNGIKSPLPDNDENEAGGYKQVPGISKQAGASLSFAINTDQYARTFQDRSFMFNIKPTTGANGRRLQEVAGCKKIFNLGVRGKRGNIVQTYPSVEYDFTPDHILAEEGDCVHVQWTGSDYNPNRNGNNGEGGPYAANNRNKETKSDRSNFVQMINAGDNLPELESTKFNVFGANANYKQLAFQNQNIDDPAACLSFQALKQKFNNRANREETHLNCAKLSGVKTPYFDAGVQRLATTGNWEYMSTRNNNFSNRGQKGVITVVPRGEKPLVNPDGSPAATGGGVDIATVAIVIFAAVGVAGGAVVARNRMQRTDAAVDVRPSSGNKMQVAAPAYPAHFPGRATQQNPHYHHQQALQQQQRPW